MLQTVAAGHDRRAELLHPCVPGLLQSLHFLGGRPGPALRRFAIDEQELRHDTLLQTISPAPAEARPPPYATTTNERRHFGHRSQLFCKCVPGPGAGSPRPPNEGAAPDRGVTAFRASPPHQPPRQVSESLGLTPEALVQSRRRSPARRCRVPPAPPGPAPG